MAIVANSQPEFLPPPNKERVSVMFYNLPCGSSQFSAARRKQKNWERQSRRANIGMSWLFSFLSVQSRHCKFSLLRDKAQSSYHGVFLVWPNFFHHSQSFSYSQPWLKFWKWVLNGARERWNYKNFLFWFVLRRMLSFVGMYIELDSKRSELRARHKNKQSFKVNHMGLCRLESICLEHKRQGRWMGENYSAEAHHPQAFDQIIYYDCAKGAENWIVFYIVFVYRRMCGTIFYLQISIIYSFNVFFFICYWSI